MNAIAAASPFAHLTRAPASVSAEVTAKAKKEADDEMARKKEEEEKAAKEKEDAEAAKKKEDEEAAAKKEKDDESDDENDEKARLCSDQQGCIRGARQRMTIRHAPQRFGHGRQHQQECREAQADGLDIGGRTSQA